ncbi:MAG: choice-of-anchor D domain-containing protein, partial [Gammaproteobacteria bacterium]|nr:choice-of-anchor D domain-containing protein [Gammaproteobacteria bacterium]
MKNMLVAVVCATTLALGGCGSASVAGLGALAALAAGLGGSGKDKKQAQIAVSPGSLSFQDQITAKPSAPQTLQISNIGEANLSVGAVTVTGTDASVFTVMNECTVSVAPGQSCVVKIVFAPQSTGTKSASVTITSNASNTAAPVSVSGSGVLPPAPSVNPIGVVSVDVLGI